MPNAVVAGHICLDIIPAIGTLPSDGTLVVPGRLVHVGPAALATGGAVSNTGMALHRLGIPTRLMGKIGDDLFGRAVLDVIRRRDPALADGMIVEAGGVTSYTVVINPPGQDRAFLHCTGTNDTFGAADVNPAHVAAADLFHFGYPPIMRRMYGDGGRELVALMQQVKAAGPITSLDMAHVDVDSAAGRVDWSALLGAVLPSVDFFMPSLDEALFALDPVRGRALMAEAGAANLATVGGMALLDELADVLLGMGAAVVGLKLGDCGLFVKSTGDLARLRAVGRAGLDESWQVRQLYAPTFDVTVAGTTGAGDCAIAGFMAALLRGMGPVDAISRAVAAGACNVEQPDAISGVPEWDALEQRLRTSWRQRPGIAAPEGWRASGGVWRGPLDRVTVAA